MGSINAAKCNFGRSTRTVASIGIVTNHIVIVLHSPLLNENDVGRFIKKRK